MLPVQYLYGNLSGIEIYHRLGYRRRSSAEGPSFAELITPELLFELFPDFCHDADFIPGKEFVLFDGRITRQVPNFDAMRFVQALTRQDLLLKKFHWPLKGVLL